MVQMRPHILVVAIATLLHVLQVCVAGNQSSHGVLSSNRGQLESSPARTRHSKMIVKISGSMIALEGSSLELGVGAMVVQLQGTERAKPFASY